MRVIFGFLKQSLIGVALLSFFWVGVAAEEKEDDRKERPSNQNTTIAPIIAYSSTYKLILGAGYFITPKEIPSHYMGLQAFGTFEKVYKMIFDYRSYTGKLLSWSLNSTLSNFYDPYYGEGFNTLVQDFRKLQNNRISIRPDLIFSLNNDYFVTLLLDYRMREQQSPVASDSDTPVFPDERSLAVGWSSGFDNRNRPLSPERGGYYQFLWRYHPRKWTLPVESDDFVQAELDLRHYFSLYNSVLALRLIGGTTSGNPTYLFRYRLGGELLRGFYTNRFRGNHFYATQAEGRIPILKNRIEGLLFWDLGSITDGAFESPKSTSGLGALFSLPPSYTMKARLEVGFGKDQTSVTLAFGDTF